MPGWISKLRDRGILVEARKYFINTLFDSVFTLLGIIVGSAFPATPNLRTLIPTMITSSLALGISSGVSVFEAETIERKNELKRLQQAMLTDLERSRLVGEIRLDSLLISSIIFLTPLLSCIALVTPYLLSMIRAIPVLWASISALTEALGILFSAGVYFTEEEMDNPLLRGVRMAALGGGAFLIGFMIEHRFT